MSFFLSALMYPYAPDRCSIGMIWEASRSRLCIGRDAIVTFHLIVEFLDSEFTSQMQD